MTRRVFTPRPPSYRARSAAQATRLTLRPVSLSLPRNPIGLAGARLILASGLAALGSTARDTRVEKVDEHVPGLGRVRGEWVRAGRTREDAAIFYIHGSGYAACSPRSHRGLVSRLSAATGLPAFSLDYRLAPRHRFPAAADDTQRAFDWLTMSHLPAERIVVAGDSAGGHLAIGLCLERRRAQQSMPAAVAAFSPLADVTLGLAARREQVAPDPMTSAEAAAHLVGHYIEGSDAAHPRLSHAFAPGEALPPTLIQAGGLEMLAADAHHLHTALLAAGGESHLEVWPGQMHVFQAMPRLIPEAQPALLRAARFLTDALAHSATEAAETDLEEQTA